MCPAFAAVLLFFLARIILIASVSGTSCILAMQERLIGVLGQGKHLLAMPRSRFGCSAQSFILWESAENVNAWIAKLFLILTFPAQEIYMFDLLLDLAQRATLACGAGATVVAIDLAEQSSLTHAKNFKSCPCLGYIENLIALQQSSVTRANFNPRISPGDKGILLKVPDAWSFVRFVVHLLTSLSPERAFNAARGVNLTFHVSGQMYSVDICGHKTRTAWHWASYSLINDLYAWRFAFSHRDTDRERDIASYRTLRHWPTMCWKRSIDPPAWPQLPWSVPKYL